MVGPPFEQGGPTADRAPGDAVRPGTTIAAVSIEHYENFPVASVLCPPALRPPIQAIYHFARTADDLADEGDATPEQRRELLLRYREALHGPATDGEAGPWPRIFTPLRQAIRSFALPLPLLDDLLDAFIQDVGNPRYESREQLLDYCRRSANPIGRLLLHLRGIHAPAALERSDAICTALQLVNFWQDLSVDLPRGRIYIPAADARRHGLHLQTLADVGDNAATRALLAELAAWAASLMREGAPLALAIPGRMGWELRLVVQGGLRILERIGAMDYRTLTQRPVLRRSDWPAMAWRAWCMRRGDPTPGFVLR
jgi:hydroxysqualene synthase